MVFDQSQENKAVNLGLTKLPRPFITGMKLNADVRINGLTLNTIDEETGVVWVCTDIENWWNMSAVEIPDIPRGLDDGSYDVKGRWTAKVITLKGSALVPDASKTPAARQKLLNAINLVKKGAWLFVDESPKKAAYVRLSGQPLVSNVNARGRIDFEVQLKAGDPIKYGWEGSESGDGYITASIGTSVTVNNAGDTPVAALFSIAGPITAPAYITSTNDITDEVQTIKIIKNLRSTSYAVTNISSRELQSGVATLTAPDHGFMVGDIVDITSISTDFNADDVKLTAVTESTISYNKPLVTISTISLTSNVVTITTAASHGLSSGAVIFVSDSGNPLLDGQYTASTASGSTITAAKTLANQASAAGGTLSKQITSVSSSGTVTLVTADTLDIDTYNTTTNYRGYANNSRSMLDANISWIKLYPGDNVITFNKTGGTGTATVKYRPGWIG